MLTTKADSSPNWKIAMIHESGTSLVRFESVHHPGNVMTIYYNRRRRRVGRYLQVNRSASAKNMTGHEENDDAKKHVKSKAIHFTGMKSNMSISDRDDLWPELKPLADASPLDTSFQVREVDGGYEIWDPKYEVALASANPDWTFADEAAESGVAECSDTHDCGKDRHVVTFQPPLPEEAISTKDHMDINAIGGLYGWQALIIIGLVVGCCCFALSK